MRTGTAIRASLGLLAMWAIASSGASGEGEAAMCIPHGGSCMASPVPNPCCDTADECRADSFPKFVCQTSKAEPAPSRRASAMPSPNQRYLAKPASVGRPHVCSDYPQESQRLGEQGTVILEFVIETDGSVARVKVFKSSGSDRLDMAAIQCARTWRYRPAIGENGKPVAVPWKAGVEWKLNRR